MKTKAQLPGIVDIGDGQWVDARWIEAVDTVTTVGVDDKAIVRMHGGQPYASRLQALTIVHRWADALMRLEMMNELARLGARPQIVHEEEPAPRKPRFLGEPI